MYDEIKSMHDLTVSLTDYCSYKYIHVKCENHVRTLKLPIIESLSTIKLMTCLAFGVKNGTCELKSNGAVIDNDMLIKNALYIYNKIVLDVEFDSDELNITDYIEGDKRSQSDKENNSKICNRNDAYGAKINFSNVQSRKVSSPDLEKHKLTRDVNIEKIFSKKSRIEYERQEDNKSHVQDSHSDSIRMGGSLISSVWSNEKEAVRQFSENFKKRYPESVVDFAELSLSDAIREAKQLRKQLLVYIHNDSKQCLGFYTFPYRTLGSKSFFEKINKDKFIIWPWDITNDDNKHKFFLMFSKHFNTVSAAALMKHQDDLPALLVTKNIHKNQEITDVFDNYSFTNEILASFKKYFLNNNYQ